MRKVSHYEAHWRNKRQAAVGAPAADLNSPAELVAKSAVADTPPIEAESVDSPASIETENSDDLSAESDQSSAPDEARGDAAVDDESDDELGGVTAPPGEAPLSKSERRRQRRRNRGRQGGAAGAA